MRIQVLSVLLAEQQALTHREIEGRMKSETAVRSRNTLPDS